MTRDLYPSATSIEGLNGRTFRHIHWIATREAKGGVGALEPEVGG